MATNASIRRFRQLVGAAIVATFLLVVVGCVVRVGDSGLGCGPAGAGLRGWPLCQGRLVPGTHPHTVVEYTHRFLAALVVVLLVAILWQALRHLRDRRPLVLGAAGAVVLVLVQAVLGGLTVEHGLRTALVAAHLGAAMLLLGVLIGLLAATRAPARGAPASRALRWLALAACALLLATIVAGGVIAGTERHGTPSEALASGAHLACGHEFPACNGAFLPFGSGEMVDIQLVHRSLMFLAVAAIAALALALWRRREPGELAYAIALVLATQVLLGAANVWLGEHALLIVAHLALGTLLWVLVAIATAALWARADRPLPAVASAG